MNSILEIVCLLGIALLGSAEYHGSGAAAGYGYAGTGYGHAHVKVPVKKTLDYYAVPKYTYSYGVDDHYTGDKKSAHETRNGDLTKGHYTVLQPDGVLRTVSYVADPIHGFQATVHNSAPAIHAVKKVVASGLAYGHADHQGRY